MGDRRIMGRPRKRYNIRVRGDQREDTDADLLMQALLQIAEERTQGTEEPETLGDDDAGQAAEERPQRWL
jgi:predicted ArsR family transcriptional regulator